MQAAGELEGAGSGRYRLAGRLLQRQARQEQSRHPRLAGWSGRWRIGVVTVDRRAAADRAGLRDAMRALRLAEWRPGVWARPDNLPHDTLPAAESTVAAQCTWVDGRPDADDRQLSASLWD